MHKSSIKIPVYNSTCHIIIDNEIEKVINKYAKKHGWDEKHYIPNGDKVDGFAVTTGENSYYAFYEQQGLGVNILVHEISHIVDFILTEKDIELVGESRAYLTAHISERIFDFAIKNKLLINKWLPKEETKKEIQNTPALNQ